MIGWGDVYKVVEAMVPLYVALMLGYGSVKWWRIFTREQCDAINRLVCFFTLPLFTFEFTAHMDPFKMNLRFIGADTVSKFIIVAVLGIWAKWGGKGSYCWSITSFSLSTLTNALVVGVPLVKAMYGDMAVQLVVQLSAVQAIVWLTFLLFVLEFRRSTAGSIGDHQTSTVLKTQSQSAGHPAGKDSEAVSADHGDMDVVDMEMDMAVGKRPSICILMRMVWLKLAMNPNSYACLVGVAWACIASRWNLQMPGIVKGSISILSQAGIGTAMFNMGIFMALQEKIIACGPSLTVLGMVLRFIAGPAATAIGAIAVGLHGDVLRVAIIQSAVPQSITSFIYAREYGLHAEVLSTAVIFGTVVSLPVLVAYYATLELVH